MANVADLVPRRIDAIVSHPGYGRREGGRREGGERGYFKSLVL